MIYRSFIWSSGADFDTLEKVPSEKNKYFGIGGTIIFTALMASFAGGYAFFTAFKDPVLPFFFGAFWGALIFNLDRFIVSTFGVGDGKKTISKQELIEAAPRLLMAVILGFVISTPLELKIFESEIKTKVERLKIEKSQELMKSDSGFLDDLENKKKRFTEVENKIYDLRNNQQQLMSNAVAFIESRKKEYINDLKQKEGELNIAQNQLNSVYNNLLRARNDTTGRYAPSSISAIERNHRELTSRRNELRSQKQDIENKIRALETDIESEQRAQLNSIRSEIELLSTERVSLSEQITGLESTKRNKEKGYDDVSENYDGFAAHLEALSLLTDEKPIIKAAKWMITLLFIFIEIAPILFKMMTERGPYDDMMDKLKHDIKVKQLLEISNINEEVNTLVKINRERNAQKLSAELAANDSLLNLISDAQAEIVKEAINEWKRKQIDAVVANPELLIKDNIRNNI